MQNTKKIILITLTIMSLMLCQTVFANAKNIQPNKATNTFSKTADNDNDGLTNEQELIYGTDMNNTDTNGNGISDGNEVNAGTNPLKREKNVTPPKKEKFIANKVTAKKTKKQIKTSDNKVSIDADGWEGNSNSKIKAIKIDDPFLKATKGVVGKPVEIEADQFEVESANISISYDQETLNNIKEGDLAIFWVDRENNKLVKLDNQVIDLKNKTVTAKTTHFSTYILGSQYMISDLDKVDIVFAVDQSNIMASKDATNTRLKTVQKFVDEMNAINNGKDSLRMGVVEFSNFGELKQQITNNAITLTSTLTSMNYTLGASNIIDGLWVSNSQFENFSHALGAGNSVNSKRRKVVVLITDGKDTDGNKREQIEDFTKTLNNKWIELDEQFYNHVDVNTVAISSDSDTQMLKNVAETTGGGYFEFNAIQNKDDQIKTFYDIMIKKIRIAFITDNYIPTVVANMMFSEKYRGMDFEDAKKLYANTNANLLTGNFVQKIVDAKIYSQGIDLNFERVYNSDAGGEKTIIGNGWRTNYDTSAKDVTNSGKVIVNVLNVRDAVGTGNIITTVSQNTKLTYLEPATTYPYNSRDWRLVQLSDGTSGFVAITGYVAPIVGVEITYGTGTKAVYDLFDNSDPITWYYTTPKGMYDILIRTNNLYYLTRKDQTTYAFNLNGQLSTVTDKYGNELVVHYTGNKISSVTDFLGRAITFTYTGENLTRITDSLARYTDYSYDTNNNLVSVKDFDGKTTVYSYYDTYNKTTLAFERSRIKKITDGNANQVLKNDYDPYGRLVRQYDANNAVKYHMYKDVYMDEDTGLPTGDTEFARYYIDENGNVTKIIFNIDTQDPISEIDANNIAIAHQWNIGHNIETITDKKGTVTAYYYDASGNITKIEDQPSLNSITMTYNAKNNITSKMDKKGNTTTYSYYDDVTLDTITDALGNTTKYEYFTKGVDPGIQIFGLVKKITESRKNNLNNLVVFKTTQYQYDTVAWNNLKQMTDSNGNVTQYLYDTAGRLTQVTDPKLNLTKYTYSSMDRLTQEEDATGNKTYITYDNVGNKLTVRDKRGNTTKYEYDNKNQLIKLTDPLNKYTVFKYDNLGNKIEEINELGVSTKYSYDVFGNCTQITDALGGITQSSYDFNNNLTQFIDAENRTTTYEYDTLNRKTMETKPLGKITNFAYDLNNNITTVTDALGKITKYDYDVLNRKTSQIDGFGAQNITTIYQYYIDSDGTNTVVTTDPRNNVWKKKSNSLDQLVKEIDAKNNFKTYTYDTAGNLETITDERGNTTTNQYNSLNKLIKVTDPTSNYSTFEYDQIGNKIAEIDRNKRRTEFAYDANNRLTSTINALKYSITATYNAVGNKTSVTDEIGNVTTYYYDVLNRMIGEKDSLGNTCYFEYDMVGNKISETDKKTHTSGDDYVLPVTNETGATIYRLKTRYVYDNLNRLDFVLNQQGTKIQDNSYDVIGNTLTKMDGNSNVVTYNYNSLYRLTSVVNPTDSSIPTYTVNYTYDNAGNITRQEDSLGAVQLFSYDENGRNISKSEQKLDTTGNITISTQYDEKGNKLSETDGNGVTTQYGYNAVDRVTTTTKSGKSTTYSYDANGNKLSETDWRGNSFTNTYDWLNRLKYTKDPYSITVKRVLYYNNGMALSSEDALGNITAFEYDANKNLKKTTDPELKTVNMTYDVDGNLKTKVDGKGNVTTFNYDETNKLISVVNAKNETTSYTYDYNDNMLTQTDGKGNITTFIYNVVNKPINKVDHNGAGVGAKTETYLYFANGSLASKVDRNGITTSFVYDVHGRLTGKTAGAVNVGYTYDGNGNQLTVVDATGTTTRTYDALNRVLTKNTPNVGVAMYEYDIITGVGTGEIGERTTDPKGNIVTKINDRAGRLKSVTADANTTNYTYFSNGNRESVVYSSGVKELYEYYKNNLLKTLDNKKADNTVISSYSYEYDLANNQTKKTDTKGNTLYTYDELNRLKTITEPNGKVTTYTFDMAGNRIEEKVEFGGDILITSYVVNEQNRLMSTQTTLNVVVTEDRVYSYDNNGNQLEVIINGVTSVTNTYDSLNRLVGSDTGSNVVVNGYNGEDLRVSKDINGVLTRYLYEFDKVVLELDGSGNQIARNVYGINLLNRIFDGLSLDYLYNGHADVTELVDANGNIIQSYDYDAFGNQKELNNNLLTKEDGNCESIVGWTTDIGRSLQLESNIKLFEESSFKIPMTGYQESPCGITSTAKYPIIAGKYYFYSMYFTSNSLLTPNARLYVGNQWSGYIAFSGKNGTWGRDGFKFLADTTSFQQIEIDFYNPIPANEGYTSYIDGLKLIEITAEEYNNLSIEQLMLKYPFEETDNPFRYSGYQWDKETGMYYLMSRMYDPVTARFMSEDTYRGSVEDPLSLNLYTYCENEPVMHYDPTGHNLSQLLNGGIEDDQDLWRLNNNTRKYDSVEEVLNRSIFIQKKAEETEVDTSSEFYSPSYYRQEGEYYGVKTRTLNGATAFMTEVGMWKDPNSVTPILDKGFYDAPKISKPNLTYLDNIRAFEGGKLAGEMIFDETFPNNFPIARSDSHPARVCH